jgi:ActR/RegA family two-component response regulator
MSNQATQQRALLVHPDIGVLASLQAALARENYLPIVARDLPSALLAITQHHFRIALIAADLGEPGAGWPLAGVVRLAFPKAYVCVLDQRESQVSVYRNAINYHVQQVYTQSSNAEEIAASLLADVKRSAENLADEARQR